MSLDVLICVPTHDGGIHRAAVGGIYTCVAKLGGEKVGLVVRQGSFLPRLRDQLSIDFLESGAKYMLCLDADVGFTVKALETMLARSKELVADREFIAGAYAKKNVQDPRPICAFNGEVMSSNMPLRGAHFVGAGFMLLPRQGMLRMVERYHELSYPADTVNPSSGKLVGLWSPYCAVKDTEKNERYLGEDYSFCERWRQMGGKIWVDESLGLLHCGEAIYTLQGET